MEIKNIAIGTLTMFLLVSLGFNVSPNDNYVCRSLDMTKYCDHLSSTENTCYPFDYTTKGKKYCESGWESIIQEEIVTINNKQKNYLCDNKKCVDL